MKKLLKWCMFTFVVFISSCMQMTTLESEEQVDRQSNMPQVEGTNSIKRELETVEQLVNGQANGKHPTILSSEIPLTKDANVHQIQELEGALRVSYDSRLKKEEVEALYESYFQRNIFVTSPTVSYEENGDSSFTIYEATAENGGIIVRIGTKQDGNETIEVTIVFILENDRY